MKHSVIFLPIFFFAVSALPAPLHAQSSSAEELQALVETLLKEVNALQAKLDALQDASGAAVEEMGTVQGTTGGTAQQVIFTRLLKRGMSGDDVRDVQAYFAASPDIYPEGLVTGYFGTLTERAVQRFQQMHDIVHSGTPATTGFGQIGPKTQAAIVELTRLVASPSPKPLPPPAPEPAPQPEPQSEPDESTGETSTIVEEEASVSDIIGHWTFDETGGTTAADSSGNGNDGIAHNIDSATAWSTGQISGALLMDGTDDYVEIPHSDTQNIGAVGESYTVSFWFNRSGKPNFERWLVGKQADTSGPAPFEFRFDQEGYVTFRISNGTYAPFIRPPKTISGNGWNNIVGVRNAETDRIYIYINGEEGVGIGTEKGLSVEDTTVGSIQNDEHIRINRFDDASGFYYYDPYRIDDLRIYSRALSESEIKALYDEFK